MRALLALALASVTTAPGCRGEALPEIALVVDANAGDALSFAPKAAFVEYVEFADQRHELRLTLTSFESSCEQQRLPVAGEAMVSVLLLTPAAEPPASREYGFGLVPALDAPITQSIAIPKAQLHGRSWLFQPGGGLKLTGVTLEPHGSVAGMLDFSYPGDADHPATRIQGPFSAFICRYAPAPKL